MKAGCFQQEINVRVKESSACLSAGLLVDSLFSKVPLSHGSCLKAAVPPFSKLRSRYPAGVTQVALTSFSRMSYFSHDEPL